MLQKWCAFTSYVIKKNTSLEYSLLFLGLDDSLEIGASDPIVTRGAHLSLIYLRHLNL